MAGFQAVWSIDVGKSSLKAVKMQRERNHLEIVAVDKVNYTVEVDGIDSLHQAKDAIQTFASRNIINCPVIVSHPGHSAFSRFIQLPPVDAKKLEEMIGYEAQQQIPFPIDEVIWDYHVCTDESLGAEKEVGIFAVRSEVISDFMLDYEGAGIPLSMISVGYLGLLNYVLFDLKPSKPCVILDIGSEHTDLLVVDGKRFWVRNLGIAGNDITQALQDKFKLGFEEAERLKQSASKSDQAVKIFNVIQPSLKELVNEIHRSVGFYKSQAGEVKFEDVFLVGNGAKLIGMAKFLSEQLRFNVQVAKSFHRVRVNREANVALLQGDFPSFSASVGNGIQALGEGECEINLMPKEQQAAIEFKGKQKFVLAAAASLILLPLYLSMFFSGRLSSAEDALTQTEVVTAYKKRDDRIQEIQGELYQKLEAESKKLVDYVENRLAPLEVVESVAAIYSVFGNDATLDDTAVGESEREDKANELEGAMESQKNANKFWLAGYRIDRVFLGPQGQEINRRGKSSSGSKGVKVPSIPAYRVEAVGMCIPKTDMKASGKAVTNSLVTPLEERLAASLGPVPEGQNRVQLSLEDETDKIYEEWPDAQQKKSSEFKDIHQGTMFPFKMRWYLHAAPLPAPAVAKAEPAKKKRDKKSNKRK